MLEYTILAVIDEAKAKQITLYLARHGVQLHQVSASQEEKNKNAWKENLSKKTFIGMLNYCSFSPFSVVFF